MSSVLLDHAPTLTLHVVQGDVGPPSRVPQPVRGPVVVESVLGKFPGRVLGHDGAAISMPYLRL